MNEAGTPPPEGRAWLTPGRARIIVALLVVAAYAPSFFGEFVFDDFRFIAENEAVHALSPGNAVRYFTDPGTLAPIDWQGIYRPLRTLEFAVDWSISGGAPWFFHARSVTYHVIGAWLALALFGHLLGRSGGSVDPRAFLGALVFALHPIQTESVAWISSRSDLQSLGLFLGALVLHVRGRRLSAALLLVLAVLAKESAVVFAAAALLTDWFRRARPRWRWYGVYVGIGIVYTAFWMLHVAGGAPQGMGQTEGWWGGAYAMNLLTVARGFVYYAKLLFLPVQQAIDYHVPARVAVDAGAVVSVVLLAVLVGLAVQGGRRSRFAMLWFAAAIFPVSSLLIRMSIPTTERFLLLPSVGIAFWAGHLLARTRLAGVVLACFLALTFARCFAWSDEATLWRETLKAASTPRALCFEGFVEIERAEESGDPADAERVLRMADEYFRLYREDIRVGPEPPKTTGLGRTGGELLWYRARALLLLGRAPEALEEARRAVSVGTPARCTAGIALMRLGRLREAAEEFRLSIESGEEISGTRELLAEVLVGIGRECQDAGRMDQARYFYGESLRWLPGPGQNRAATEALRGLDR